MIKKLMLGELKLFVAVPCLKPVLSREGLCGFMSERTQGSTGTGSGLKRLRRLGLGLKSYLTGDRTLDPWVQE